jgi:hypothetical protein
VRRIVIWILMLVALGALAYVISIPHSQRPCLVLHPGACNQSRGGETHM